MNQSITNKQSMCHANTRKYFEVTKLQHFNKGQLICNNKSLERVHSLFNSTVWAGVGEMKSKSSKGLTFAIKKFSF